MCAKRVGIEFEGDALRSVVCIKRRADALTNLPTRARWYANRRMRLVLATKRETDMTQDFWLFTTTASAQVLAQLKVAAERGDGDAACTLGDMHREGSGGVRHSPKWTFCWYACGAITGHARCQNNLGACYEHGIGCKQSYRIAVNWYRKAAAQALASASSNLGHCYLSGHGVRADKGMALAWFEKALAEGHERAAEMVNKLGGAAPSKPSASEAAGVQVRFTDATEAGENFGIVGVNGVAPPEDSESQ
jgi:TPR repeat protein